MKLSFACLCDYAADYSGKLTVVGAFDTIWAKKFPSMHPQCSVALRMLFSHEDSGEHRINLRLIDGDGRFIIPEEKMPKVGFRLGKLPEKVFFLTKNFVFHFQGLPIPAPGPHEVKIHFDDQPISSLPIQFVEHPGPNPA